MEGKNARTSVKRKDPPVTIAHGQAPGNAKKAQKRVRTYDARVIAAQTSDKALQNGELDVGRFVKAREWEIRALEAGMKGAKKALSTRAHQTVPRDMRRRTASHNVKRIPRRLRPRAADEMAKENTPTVTSKTRKPRNTRTRLRLETAKRLHGLAVMARRFSKAEKEKLSRGSGSKEPSKPSMIRTRKARIKATATATTNRAGTLSAPPKPPVRFRKRQIHKAWLPTHLFHSKRARMTSPVYPLWRFAIPLTPTEKSYRPTHRAKGIRGAIAWDSSYMATIGLHGTEASMVQLLQALGASTASLEGSLRGIQGEKWRGGKRAWSGWASIDKQNGRTELCPVTILWCAAGAGSKDVDMANDMPSRTSHRRAFIRVHPAAFLQLWTTVLKLSKKQSPAVMIEDLRFEIGSIEITGPESTEALIGVLHPVQKQHYDAAAAAAASTAAPDQQSPATTWKSLRGLNNPSSLPTGALLGFCVSDPRLHHPPKTLLPAVSSAAAEEIRLLDVLSSWSPDLTQMMPAIFDRQARLKSCRQLPAQQAINRRKHLASPGAYPLAVATDPEIPVLLMADRPSRNGQGSWTVLLPWKCVLPAWYALMHYPLSSSGRVRFGGLDEMRQVTYEAGRPWFPGDYPGTEAGWTWELQERERRRGDWEKRPKGKRSEWTSLDLGQAGRGEIGAGWACDWERLVGGRSAHRAVPETVDDAAAREKATGDTLDAVRSAAVSGHAELKEPSPASPGIHHVSCQTARATLGMSKTSCMAAEPHGQITRGLVSVKLTCVGRGNPSPCARVYRLPITDSALRDQWLAVLPKSHRHLRRERGREPCPRTTRPEKHHDADTFARRQNLAASLLIGPLPRKGGPQAGDENYPAVPAEEDLVGFVTTGAFSLGEGRGVAIGCLLLDKLRSDTYPGRVCEQPCLCIIRDAGQALGRLAHWELV